MKNYNYLTKKEIDGLIAEYEQEKMKLLKARELANRELIMKATGRGKQAN